MRTENQKIKILCLMNILKEQTDEDHVLTVQQLIDALERRQIHAERKSVYDDINTLKEFGMDILFRKARPSGYFVASREFELPELKLLADAVASSKFITERKSAQLIHKIESLTNVQQAVQIQRQVYVRGRVKAANEKIYYNVDRIHQAIAQKKQISFRYYEYTVEKTKHYRHEGDLYQASPYAMEWDSENYYMIAYYERYGGICQFRVDKMENISVLKNDREELPENTVFDPAEYSKKLFNMFGGEEERLRLCFDNSLVGVVLDRFGQETELQRYDDGNFTVNVKAFVSPTLIGWIFSFGDKVRVLEPDSLKEELRRQAAACCARYGHPSDAV